MKVLLRLREVDDQTVVQLAQAHVGGEEAPEGANHLYWFLDLKSIQFDESNEAQVDLKLDTEFPENGKPGTPLSPVTREMLGPLWDILGIFPTASVNVPEDVEEFAGTIVGALITLQSLVDSEKDEARRVKLESVHRIIGVNVQRIRNRIPKIRA